MDWIRTWIWTTFVVSCVIEASANDLGSPCTKDRHCKVDNSFCFSGVCTCKHYHAPLNNTACLESKLLGRECIVSEQCSLRVANSTCTAGHCHCAQGFVRFRKHTCLGPAKPGDVCYSDEHCQLWSKNSHCEFLIPKLFGKCICDGGNDQGMCEPNEPPKPLESSTPTETDDNNNKTETVTMETGDYANKEQEEETDGEESKDNFWEENSSSQTETPFSDPFKNQKEHIGNMKEEEAVTNVAQEESYDGTTEEVSTDGIPVAEDALLDKETTTKDEDLPLNTDAPQLETANSKYRVEDANKENQDEVWEEVKAVSLGFPCESDAQCQREDAESRCLDGVCDCVIKTNRTKACGKDNTGCGPETFQCRSSGLCISWFFVCDGRDDCPDRSDEECGGPNCPKSSYQCRSDKSCVSRAVICDGMKNCPNGEDEEFCSPSKRNDTEGCPDHTFQCANGQCLPEFEFCNAIPKCGDGSDESPHLCSSASFKRKKSRDYCPFECGNGRCRSTAIVCSGRDGCGDNSDESKCNICRCPKVP